MQSMSTVNRIVTDLEFSKQISASNQFNKYSIYPILYVM